MAKELKVVEPPHKPSLIRRVYARVAATRFAMMISRNINWKLDPVLLRISGGRLSTTLMFRAAVLETRGARTGERRRNAVIYFHDDDLVTIVASNAGAPHHPSWFHNLCNEPQVTLREIRMQAFIVEDEQERERLMDLGDRVFPAFARYRQQAARTGRTVPIIQLAPRS